MEELKVEQETSENKKEFAQEVKVLVENQGVVQVTSQLFYLEGITTTIFFYKDVETAESHRHTMIDNGWTVQFNGELPLFESDDKDEEITTLFIQYAQITASKED